VHLHEACSRRKACCPCQFGDLLTVNSLTMRSPFGHVLDAAIFCAPWCAALMPCISAPAPRRHATFSVARVQDEIGIASLVERLRELFWCRIISVELSKPTSVRAHAFTLAHVPFSDARRVTGSLRRRAAIPRPPMDLVILSPARIGPGQAGTPPADARCGSPNASAYRSVASTFDVSFSPSRASRSMFGVAAPSCAAAERAGSRSPYRRSATRRYSASCRSWRAAHPASFALPSSCAGNESAGSMLSLTRTALRSVDAAQNTRPAA